MTDKNNINKYVTSQDTREAVCRLLKPSDCALKVKRVSNARNNGVKIEAINPYIEKIKTHPKLTEAGLKVVENVKMNPRLIVFGVPCSMTADEIEKEIIAQNFNDSNDVIRTDLKIVYIYKARENRQFTNCILEVSPDMRKQLFNNRRIYLRFSAYNFADYVRVLQCYKCLGFGHLAKNCTSNSACGHCAGPHQMKDCRNREQPPVCSNCMRNSRGSDTPAHSALDIKKYPILCSKMKDRISGINYE